MPIIGYDPTPPVSPDQKKIALARLESEALDWARDHGDHFPALRDMCHEIGVQIDREREGL